MSLVGAWVVDKADARGYGDSALIADAKEGTIKCAVTGISCAASRRIDKRIDPGPASSRFARDVSKFFANAAIEIPSAQKTSCPPGYILW
jgi:hypothetical protein